MNPFDLPREELARLAEEHGTPIYVVSREQVVANYRRLDANLPAVTLFYAVKANPDPDIVRTLYRAGASFDVASLPEFRIVHANIAHLPAAEQQAWIWDKIIYANPIKDRHTLEELNPYKPLVTYDNRAEIDKIRRYAPQAGLILRVDVPNTGSVVELSSKFGASPAGLFQASRGKKRSTVCRRARSGSS